MVINRYIGGGADSIANMAKPSNVYENLVIANNNWTANTFTALANGYVNVKYNTTTINGNLGVYMDSSVSMYECKHNEKISIIIPVSKNSVYSIYCKDGSLELARFIYSIGSAKKLGLIA